MPNILGAAAIELTDVTVASELAMEQIRISIWMWLGGFIGFCIASLAFVLFLLVDDICKEKCFKERFIEKVKSIVRH